MERTGANVAKPVKTKKERDKLIGSFTSGAKTTAKLITQYLYGKHGDTNAIPKRERERLMDAADILTMDFFRFVRLGVEGAESEPICEPAVMTALASFKETDAHYTYTMNNNDEDNNADAEEDQSDDDIEDGEDDPHFLPV